jgi:hypothetical protein
MGYCFDYKGRLVCDGCGVSGGVRKRKCSFKVLGDSRYGPRHALPYCPAPAVCGECFKKHGGSKGIHGGCKGGAEASQAEADEVERLLDEGEYFAASAYGDWNKTVPEGKVGVIYRGRAGERRVLLASRDYAGPGAGRPLLSSVAHEDWEGPG